MRTLYIECNMGCAGDMLMSALYELLEDQEGFLTTMNGLGVPGLEVTAQRASTSCIVGTHMAVTVYGEAEESHDVGEGTPRYKDSHSGHHATLTDIRGHIARLPLPQDVLERAVKVYNRLGAAEAKVHGRPVDQVHFHEVGALDAVADITGVCYALSLLRVDQIIVSPVHVGSGSVRSAHGVLPVPAPATAALLEGVSCYGGTIQGELCTPTGAALLKEFADSFGAMPLMTIEKTGYGVGKKKFEAANCVRAFLGETQEAPCANGEIIELVCNIDDMTPETLAHGCQRLLQLGALDVYTTPGTMKKGRAGWELTVLCNPDQEGVLAKGILTHTTTNGVRVCKCGKYYLKTSVVPMDTKWGPVRLKQAEGFGVCHVKPEYDDVSNLAKENDVPIQTVLEEIWKNNKG